MINFPQHTITGLLNGSITRVFEVIRPKPNDTLNGHPIRRKKYVTGGWSIKYFPNPFGSPGTIHTIDGHQFVVVESGVKQYSDITDMEWDEAGNPPETATQPSDTWLWTAELRRKDEDE